MKRIIIEWAWAIWAFCSIGFLVGSATIYYYVITIIMMILYFCSEHSKQQCDKFKGE